MKISKNSWHYKVANLTGDLSYERKVDLCRYINRFVVSVILIGSITTVGVGATISFGEMFGWIAAMMVVGIFTEPQGIVPLAIAATILAAIFGCWYLWEEKLKGSLRETKPAGAVRLIYKRVTSKFCVLLTVDDDK